MVPWLQRRHREHAVLEYPVGVTEEYMEERGIAPRQPKQPPARIGINAGAVVAACR
jgi:hypothetical protein